jgi:outer membrane protein TolC
MLRASLILLLLTLSAGAEVYNLTLQQTIDLAWKQNPDVALARLDQQKAQQGIQVALDPFRPKVYGGSGLAYTYGYPNTIEGNAPSLFQMRTDMALYNRSSSYALSSAREQARGASFATQAKADDIAYQAADLYLTAASLEQEIEALNNQIPSLKKVSDSMQAAVENGAELPLEQKRAQVNLAMAQQRLDAARLDADYYEMTLAIMLGYAANDRVKPVTANPPVLTTPTSESEAADLALKNNKELRQLQSSLLAKQLDLKSIKAQRLPKFDLVAQYALFTKQNYDQFFAANKFQRNNAQIGASITIPLLTGSATRAYADQAQTDLQKLGLQVDQIRSRILSNTQRDYQQSAKAEQIRNLARMQLDLAREQLNVLLAQFNEGRVPMSRVEQARAEESDRWIALYDSEAQVTRAKLAILRETGTLLAAVRGSEPTQ